MVFISSYKKASLGRNIYCTNLVTWAKMSQNEAVGRNIYIMKIQFPSALQCIPWTAKVSKLIKLTYGLFSKW